MLVEERPSVFEVRWRLDPKTDAFKEYRTKTPDSGPHGLAADKDGNIWFAIGKLDPKTGTITECWREQPSARPSLCCHRATIGMGSVFRRSASGVVMLGGVTGCRRRAGTVRIAHRLYSDNVTMSLEEVPSSAKA